MPDTTMTREEREQYVAIIDKILQNSDLETITRKKIRESLQSKVNKTLDKGEVKRLIEERFNLITQAESQCIPTPTSAATAEATPEAGSSENEIKSEEGSNKEKSSLPLRKQQKRSCEDADARLAARLQAEENQLSSSRKTRGGGSAAKGSKSKGKVKMIKKKSAKRVRDYNDSDAGDGSETGAKAKRKAGGGFQKPFLLSEPLHQLVGESQVVKKLWEYIKANQLQDPNDKRQIYCDDAMQAVFKTSKVDMFGMNKHLGNHLYPVEEA